MMLVKDLIAELEKLPPGAVITIRDDYLNRTSIKEIDYNIDYDVYVIV